MDIGGLASTPQAPPGSSPSSDRATMAPASRPGFMSHPSQSARRRARRRQARAGSAVRPFRPARQVMAHEVGHRVERRGRPRSGHVRVGLAQGRAVRSDTRASQPGCSRSLATCGSTGCAGRHVPGPRWIRARRAAGRRCRDCGYPEHARTRHAGALGVVAVDHRSATPAPAQFLRGQVARRHRWQPPRRLRSLPGGGARVRGRRCEPAHGGGAGRPGSRRLRARHGGRAQARSSVHRRPRSGGIHPCRTA